jgi:outer membrane protein OmpA-like peptidoglycan-associated protein
MKLTTRLVRPIMASALIGTLLLQGCTSIDPYTGQSKINKATTATAIGAVGGAVAGVLIGDSSKAAMIGAGIGSLAGLSVGAYMDKQEAELRQQLSSTGVSVVRNGDYISLIMPGNITFRTGSADINSGFYPVLNSVALVINKFSRTAVEVSGYTDNTGSLERNTELSLQRATSVAGYLGSQGVAPQRIRTAGFGPQFPVASNATEDGRQANRRVEIKLVPQG